MRSEIVAIGTELVLGSNLDTNSRWIGEQLAKHGIESHFHTSVDDNHTRIVETLKLGLSRSDAVIVTGGLGATQDDITRAAIADVMDVSLIRDEEQAERIRSLFAVRNRTMSENNLLQAERPEGATFIQQSRGTAPGLICPVGDGVVYAVPGVPWEMQEMITGCIIPDLVRRSGSTSIVHTRTLRTWGVPESTIAEMVAPRFDALEKSDDATISFLAKGIEGIHVRITVHAPSIGVASDVIEREEQELRTILGDLVFGVDDETMETVVGNMLRSRGWSFGLAESLTGGLIASRMTNAAGASEFFRGCIVSYASDVKHLVLRVPDGPVVSEQAAAAMAVNARRVLDADVAVSVTGVAGPATQDGMPVGTVFAGFAFPDGSCDVVKMQVNGDRQRIREYTCINALDGLRKRLS